MRIAFMGTPVFAASLLAELAAAGHDIRAVYTQPQKPRGRGQAVKPTPVQTTAEGLGLPVKTPASMRNLEEIQAFGALDLDVAVVAAYGQVLKTEVLNAPRLGSFNIHASLLPRWRGAAPIHRAVMAGDVVTGVQIMRMTEGLDEGPILSTARVEIDPEETTGSLHDKLMALAGPLLISTLSTIESGRAIETPQAGEGVTYARKVTSTETHIDWARPAIEVDRTIRGLSPFPGAWFELPTPKGPVRVKALSSRLSLGRGEPGDVLDDFLLVACAQGAVRLLRVQREGKTPQNTDEFVRGLADMSELRLS